MGKLGSIVDANAGDGTGVVGDDPATVPMPSSDPTSATVPEPSLPLADVERNEFAAFYAGHYSDLVRLATVLSGPADAADLVQDCFVRLHGRWTSVHEPLPYVRRSVVHACASHHRRMARGRRLTPRPERQDSELGADELEDALAKLPSRQHAAVVLRYYADLPDADIARALRCRPGTVRSLIHRALADLRKGIEP
jgi:RNA polymerase sigma-70 factor (sigma-E family)